MALWAGVVIAAWLQQGRDLLLVDVRAMAPGMPLTGRIPDARHLDLGALSTPGDAALAGWPVAGEFITYCACPNDASAVRRGFTGSGRSSARSR